MLRKSIAGVGVIGAMCLLSSTAAADIHIQYWDTTGTIQTDVHICDPSPAAHAPTSDCSVAAGFNLVGGGAEVLNNAPDASSGALLTGSFPINGCTAWRAQSTDYQVSFVHQVRAYSIGIRFLSASAQGTQISPEDLDASISCSFADGNAVADISSPAPPPGFVLIGGGARILNPGLLLVESGPISSAGASGPWDHWVGKAKFPRTIASGNIRVWQMSIASNIPDYGNVTVGKGGATIACGAGLCTSQKIRSTTGVVATSVGGFAQFGTGGRYLAGLNPLAAINGLPVQGVTLTTKDHIFLDGGGNDGSAVNVFDFITIAKGR